MTFEIYVPAKPKTPLSTFVKARFDEKKAYFEITNDLIADDVLFVQLLTDKLHPRKILVQKCVESAKGSVKISDSFFGRNRRKIFSFRWDGHRPRNQLSSGKWRTSHCEFQKQNGSDILITLPE